ncbi:MAG TPA: hypothetical protein EYM38_00985 [Dehalococcoidia bacterium]|nr:hypothetical protein [Dehalococcoidia bacterium]
MRTNLTRLKGNTWQFRRVCQAVHLLFILKVHRNTLIMRFASKGIVMMEGIRRQ